VRLLESVMEWGTQAALSGYELDGVVIQVPVHTWARLLVDYYSQPMLDPCLLPPVAEHQSFFVYTAAGKVQVRLKETV
jgi:hypothetical protein